LLGLAIIGIISAIAIPALLGQRARARDKSAQENATSILTDIASASDKAKEAGIPITSAATLWGVMTTVKAPLVNPLCPQVLVSKNPWAGTNAAPALAYGVMTDIADSLPATIMGMSTATTLGQVETGFLAPDATTGASGVIASSAWVQAPFKDGAGVTQNVFYKMANVE
jgi:type II secretory pathway pseudopilin PulG